MWGEGVRHAAVALDGALYALGGHDGSAHLSSVESYDPRAGAWRPGAPRGLRMTEKGISDLAQHYLLKAGITCLRRLRKTDNNRIARATGATIVKRLCAL